MNLSRSFLSWELRSVSIAYGNLKYSTGLGMKSSSSFLFRFQNILPLEAISKEIKSTKVLYLSKSEHAKNFGM